MLMLFFQDSLGALLLFFFFSGHHSERVSNVKEDGTIAE